VLEGFHALKHALRFGAVVLGAWCADPEGLESLRRALAPDVQLSVQSVTPTELRRVTPRAQVVALALRPSQLDPDRVLAGEGHVLLLEDPRHLGNLGAAIRVAAAAGAAGLLTTGRLDPWHADAIRGSAGLHFAIPVHRVRTLRTGGRQLVCLHPGGMPFRPGELDGRALLAFGSERHGLSEELLGLSDRQLALPMAAGVSSLNLATAVAATLYALRLAGQHGSEC
jgi:TrmH family RNA methyltransferase